MWNRRTVTVFAAALALVGLAAAKPHDPVHATSDARAAIERSLDYVEREGFAWMEGRVPMQDGAGCVSCHHVSYGVWSLREAERLGIVRQGSRAAALERDARAFVEDEDCRAFSCAPLLLAFDPESGTRYDAALAARLTSVQQDAGHFRAKGQFPTQKRPIEESDAVATAWTWLAIEAGGSTEGWDEGCRDSAIAHLRAAPETGSTEWLVARALVELRGGIDPDPAAWTRLLARQNPDGGWPFVPDQESDAMSTGQAVYALALSHPSGEARSALSRGVDHLVATQREDGTWPMESALASAEPSEAKDYVYTYWGTTWASIGLARAIDSP